MATSSSRARSTSTHSLSLSRSTSQGEGLYVPPSYSTDSDYDFCNAFWVTPQRSRRDGADEGSDERDWGREGYETVMARVRAGGKVLEDLRGVFRERAAVEEDYAKRLTKLSKHQFGTGETGHMERAQLGLRAELEQTAKSHQDLAALLKGQETQVMDFMAKREGARKNQQTAIEKQWKSLNNQRQHVVKAKAKYEEDAIQINALHAQAALLQGRELDKATLKMDKVQQTVVVNERDYRNYVAVLKETTANWNMAWKTFCDLVQDQEEERLEFVKGRMWDWANAQSTIAMAEDESAERTRTALEQCDPKTDIRIFVQQFATGNSIPDPLPFVDATKREPQPKQSYKTAHFSRSSTRIPGVRHSPSAVNDIARALHQSPVATRQSLPPQQQQQQARSGSQGAPMAHQRSGSSGAGLPPSQSTPSRPASRSAQHPSNSNLALAAETTPTRLDPAASHEPTPTRPQVDGGTSSRFAVSPNANLRGSSEHGRTASSTSPRPGHISAAAFQNRRAASPSPSAPAANGTSPAPARYDPPAPDAPPQLAAATNEDEDDPLLQALKVLQSTPVTQPSRPHRLSTGPSAPSPSSTPMAQRPSVDLRNAAASPATHRPSQSSLGQPGAFASPAASRSRPTSPAPVAAMMQAPQTSSQGTSVPYGQAFPGERAAQAHSRPASRAGSNISSAPAANANPNRQSVGATLASPPSVGNFAPRPSSPSQGGFAGVGARGRSPSPQPFVPDSLRPRSPAVVSGRAPSPQPHAQGRPQSGFGPQGGYGRPPSQPYGAPPPSQQQGYAAAPPPTQQPAYGAPPAAASPYARTASPAPRPTSAVGYAPPPQQQQPYMAQTPSQHYQQPPAAYPNGYAYPAQQPAQPPQQQQQQQQWAAPPAQYQSPAVQRTPSMHSGVSGASVQAYQAQAAPVQQQQHARAGSVASMRAGQGAVPPPTGQYTDAGQPILFYVNALFDYAAASGEEFSFSSGDVIAVTGTDPDGWWQGQRVGDAGPSKLFPSK
ncbi:hypothetical protein JCM5296_004620 [Sporobolomyces johnsonii]